jgi:hypothetical protein
MDRHEASIATLTQKIADQTLQTTIITGQNRQQRVQQGMTVLSIILLNKRKKYHRDLFIRWKGEVKIKITPKSLCNADGTPIDKHKKRDRGKERERGKGKDKERDKKSVRESEREREGDSDDDSDRSVKEVVDYKEVVDTSKNRRRKSLLTKEDKVRAIVNVMERINWMKAREGPAFMVWRIR